MSYKLSLYLKLNILCVNLRTNILSQIWLSCKGTLLKISSQYHDFNTKALKTVVIEQYFKKYIFSPCPTLLLHPICHLQEKSCC